MKGEGFINKFKVNKGSVFVDVAIFVGKDRKSRKKRYQNYSCFVDLSLLEHWQEILDIERKVFGNGDEIIEHYKSKVLILTVLNPCISINGGFLSGDGVLKMVTFPE